MERINYRTFNLIELLDNLNPQNSGIFFSILLHLIILLFAVGLPNFFGPKDIYIQSIIPIEILNISETTNTEKTEVKNNNDKSTSSQQKKFNSSENFEIKKPVELTQKMTSIENKTQPKIEIKEKNNPDIKEKEIVEIKQKENIEIKNTIETVKLNKIKPKLKPKPKKIIPQNNNSDINIEPKNKIEQKFEENNSVTNPKPKPDEDFSIASMLKDLRNEKSNDIIEEEENEKIKTDSGLDDQEENMVLSISEIDLLRQQLSGCWNAPAGAIIERGMKVTISAKVRQNMQVLDNSVRIIDTNISKSNAFYGPITDSAMRTLLNPECTPLKLPKNKYKLWKNLTITFDYSIMKGF
ncbi:hypothetical protein OAZ22_01755 [Pelagibacteraceae bacterium]|nr:hypothetical protein [Pelagibacteraceae bacterium]